MTFNVPNLADSIEDPTGVYPQAQLDSVDLQILGSAAGGQNGISSGCAVTAQGSPNNTVAVAAGTVVVAGVEVAVTGGNVTMTAAHASLNRFDLITVNNSGTKAYTAGTAAASPVFPAIPANSVVLAAIYVPDTDNIINTAQIVDKRVMVRTPLGATGWTTLSKSADESRNTTTTFTSDSVLTFAVAANTKYRIRGVAWHNSGATPDYKWQLSGPAAPTLVAVHFELFNGTTGAFSSGGYDSAFSTSHLNTLSAGSDVHQRFAGIIHNGANSGTVAYQWAQNTSDAGATITRAGSVLEYAIA